MLPDAVADEFCTFLVGVDRHVSTRLDTKFPPDEEEMTRSFLVCLDEDDQGADGLAYTVQALNEKISDICERDGYIDEFSFSLKFDKYSKRFEGSVTQADFLLDLSFDDTQDSRMSWRALYLMQAKLPKMGTSDTLNLHARIPYREAQDNDISTLSDILGDSHRYILYCPVGVGGGEPVVIAKLKSNSVISEANVDSLCKSGIWVHSGHENTVLEMLHNVCDLSWPLANFIVDHYVRNPTCSTAGALLKIPADAEATEQQDLLRRLAERDQGAIKYIAESLGRNPVQSAPLVGALVVNVKGPGLDPKLVPAARP